MRPIAFFLLLFVLALPCSAQVHRWVDENGQVHYTQTPPPDQASEEVRLRDHREIDPGRTSYCQAIARAATRVASAMRMGVSLASVLESAREAEAEAGKVLDDASYQKLVYQVWSYRSTRMQGPEISGLIRNECMNGAYGRLPGSKSASSVKRGGTGFMVGGLIATNHHVIRSAKRIEAFFADGRSAIAVVQSSDASTDVALLRVTDLGSLPPSLPVATREAAMGATVFTLGFPHTGIMGANAKLTTGIVSAATGINDDPRSYQISVPVQAGNSGGPLLNQYGEVVGIVTSKLASARMRETTGDATENVNYAVKIQALDPLLGTPPVGDWEGHEASLEDMVAQVKPSVVRLVVE